MGLIKIGKAAKMLGVDQQTLRHWSNEGKINVIVTPKGHRLYDEEALASFLGVKAELSKNKKPKAFIYARVSTKKQADEGNLERQIARLTECAVSRGYEVFRIYKEVASGVNENRKELAKLLDDVSKEPNGVVLVEYKDRLARFGFSYIEKCVSSFGSRIEIAEAQDKSEEQELVEDLIAITTSFSARIYGKRGGRKLEKRIKKLFDEGELADENDDSGVSLLPAQ